MTFTNCLISLTLSPYPPIPSHPQPLLSLISFFNQHPTNTIKPHLIVSHTTSSQRLDSPTPNLQLHSYQYHIQTQSKSSMPIYPTQKKKKKNTTPLHLPRGRVKALLRTGA